MDSNELCQLKAVAQETLKLQAFNGLDEVRSDRFLNVSEVAQLLGVSRSSVYSWSKGGVIPPQKKFARSSRWSLQELKEWLKEVPCGAYGEGGTN